MNPYRTHDEDGMTYACPECDRAGNVYERQRDGGPALACHSCGATFDEAVERPTATDRPARRDDDGLPATLDPRAKQLIRAARGEGVSE